MWFHAKDMRRHPRITMREMCGVALPHAGTEHCGSVLSHTLRFAPQRMPRKLMLVYEPAIKEPTAHGHGDCELPERCNVLARPLWGNESKWKGRM